MCRYYTVRTLEIVLSIFQNPAKIDFMPRWYELILKMQLKKKPSEKNKLLFFDVG